MKIYVVTHNPSITGVKKNGIYEPILVGSYNKKSHNILRDDTGDNISDLNQNFCELTALYWIWKNSTEDIVGLCHYRRFFSNRWLVDDEKYFLQHDDIEQSLNGGGVSIILPRKKYGMQTNSMFGKAPSPRDMDFVRKTIDEKFPEYADAYSIYLKLHSSFLYNMLICKKEYFDEYCKWLFTIIFDLYERIPCQEYKKDSYRRRLFGFISERLLNIWLIHNSYIRIKEKYVVKTDEKIEERIRKMTKNKIEKSMFYKKDLEVASEKN